MTKLSELEALLFIVGEEGISNEELSGLLNLSESRSHKFSERIKRILHSKLALSFAYFETESHYVLTTKKSWLPC